MVFIKGRSDLPGHVGWDAEGEDKYRILFEQSNDAIFIHTFEGMILDVNQKACELLGYTKEQLLGLLISEIHPAEELAVSKKAFDKIFEQNNIRFDSKLVRSDGSVVDVAISASIFHRRKGIIQGIVRDISDRKKMENLIRKNEKKFRLLYEKAPLGYQSLDEKGDFLDVNPAWLKTMGYDKRDVIGKNFSSFLSQDSKEMFRNNFARFKSAGEINDCELEMVKKDGSTMIAGFKGRISYDLEGRFRQTHCVMEDITRHKKAERRLKEGEDRYRQLIENMKNAVAVYKPVEEGKDFIFVDFNKAGEHIEGVKREDLIGKSVLNTFPGIRDFGLFDVFQRVFKTGLPEHFPITLYKDERVRGWKENYVYRLPSGEVVAIYEDLTESKKAEDQMKFSRDTLKNIIDSIAEPVISVDKEGRITSWNKAVEQRTGIKEKDIRLMNISDPEIPPEISPLIDHLAFTLNTKKSDLRENEIEDREGNRCILLSQTSLIKDLESNITGVVMVGRDITGENEAYKGVIPGNSYLSYEPFSEGLAKILSIFGKKGYSILCVSRDERSMTKGRIECSMSLFLMSGNQNGSHPTAESPDELIGKIKSFLERNNKSVILLDRMDYLSFMHGFPSLLKFFYRLNDLIRFSENIAIANISESMFDEKELLLLKQELKPAPVTENDAVYLDQRKIAILKFISDKNAFNISVPYNLISSEFKLSRMTTKHWIEDFFSKGLIRSEKRGRVKFIQITEKGRSLISGY